LTGVSPDKRRSTTGVILSIIDIVERIKEIAAAVTPPLKRSNIRRILIKTKRNFLNSQTTVLDRRKIALVLFGDQ